MELEGAYEHMRCPKCGSEDKDIAPGVAGGGVIYIRKNTRFEDQLKHLRVRQLKCEWCGHVVTKSEFDHRRIVKVFD